MTDLEKRAITALRSVKVPDKNWHACKIKVFVAWAASYPDSPMLSFDAADLWFLVWRYRRQIADQEVVARADELLNGALHLAF